MYHICIINTLVKIYAVYKSSTFSKKILIDLYCRNKELVDATDTFIPQ